MISDHSGCSAVELRPGSIHKTLPSRTRARSPPGGWRMVLNKRISVANKTCSKAKHNTYMQRVTVAPTPGYRVLLQKLWFGLCKTFHTPTTNRTSALTTTGHCQGVEDRCANKRSVLWLPFVTLFPDQCRGQVAGLRLRTKRPKLHQRFLKACSGGAM